MIADSVETTTFHYFPPEDKSNIYRQILELFPMHFVVYCFAYGANVVPADRATPTHNSVIDVVFVVNDTVDFHTENMKRNRRHYSGLKHFDIAFITNVQEAYGGCMYVNTVRIVNITLKYSVIYALDFVWDLQTWARMYLAGRLLQPVVTLKRSTDIRIHDALEDNLVMAVHLALVLLPEKFTEHQLYETIVQVSYEGDFAISLNQAENISKSIVASQFKHFHDMYISILHTIQQLNPKQLTLADDKATWVQSIKDEDILYHLTEIPSSTVNCVFEWYLKAVDPKANIDKAFKNFSIYPRDLRVKLVRACISNLVRESSMVECVKGWFTNGIIKSLYYSASKFAKLTKSYFIEC